MLGVIRREVTENLLVICFSKRKSPLESFEKPSRLRLPKQPLCDLRPWLLDSLRFMIEQPEAAKSPEDQLAGTDAAMGLSRS